METLKLKKLTVDDQAITKNINFTILVAMRILEKSVQWEAPLFRGKLRFLEK